jgi:hypothetical protein
MSGSSWLRWQGEDDEPVPVRELYSVFGRSPTELDRTFRPLAAVAWSGIPWGAEIGEGRVLLSGLGGEQDTIYAAPLGDDRLVVAVLPNGGGGSGRPGPDGLFLQTSELETGALVFHGIVADWVESAELVVAGVTHEAQMGENAFAFRLEPALDADVERLVLHRSDGTVNEIALAPE